MSEINFEFEIPQGYYTKQELENYIQNNIFKKVQSQVCPPRPSARVLLPKIRS